MAQATADTGAEALQCHRTDEGSPLVCAGLRERGAGQDLAVRLPYMR